jgi:hypothetical protein
VLNKVKNTKWYIWLSIPAFVLLWGDTSKRIIRSQRKFSLDIPNDSKKTNLWISALGNIFKLAILDLLIPGFGFAVLIDWSANFNPVLSVVFNFVALLSLYLLGVYTTYAHVQWREKNIKHLL